MIHKISIKNMSRDDWLKERRKGIGGSDAGAILGLNPYKKAFDVYADKLELIPDKSDTEAMRQGRDLEEYVAERFEEQTKKRVRRENHIIYNTDYPSSFANIDRAIIGERAGLECKTTKCLNLKRYKNGEFPEEYYCQCMHYLMVTEYEKWYLAVLVFGSDFMIFEIERDEEEIKALAKAEEDFWNEHIQKRIPPSPDGSKSTDDILSAIYPNDNGDSCDLSLYKKELQKISELDKQIKELETEKRRCGQEIKVYMGECESGQCEGYRAAWKAQTRQTWDVKKIIEDFVPNGTDMSDYCNKTQYRVFKIKEV